jgi:colanic acid/amylovoran biosynthesis glycosyltransferase
MYEFSEVNVLMVGAGDPGSTFIQRQMEGLRAQGVDVSVLPGYRPSRLQAALYRRGFPRGVPAEWKPQLESADIIHYQWPGHWLAYRHLSARYRKPAVLSFRGRQISILPLLPGNGKYVGSLRRLLDLCSAYHCVSEAIRQDAIQLGAVAERAVVIRPAIDPSLFTPSEHRPQSPPLKVAMVGGLIWRKGYDFAMLALERLVESGRDVRLTIVGEGSERDRVEYMREQLQLQDRVHLTGALPPESVLEVLRSSHVLLLASLSEGIANAVLEAMACGLPVVTTDAGGMKEVVRDGAEGLVIPTRSAAAIADAVGRLYDDAGLRERLGATGRASVVRKHTLEQQARAFVQLYERVLATRVVA